MFLCLHREPIKFRDKKFALFTEATGAFPVSWGSEDAERLPVQVLETWADKWTQGASVLQGISLKKRKEGERENDWHGETKLLQWARPKNFIFSKGTFIPCLIHRGKWKMQGHTESAQTFQQFCPYWNQDFFFCKPFPQMMLCTLSSGPGGLWTFYDPLLIKAAQPENLFSLKVSFLYISNLCQPQEMLNRVTFFPRQRCSELQERTN